MNNISEITTSSQQEKPTVATSDPENGQLLSPKTALPLVSIVIPVYNSEKYIQIAIDSILEQTYSNYEIIVVDDGSIDYTRQKLQLYQGKIRYIYQENQGSAAARNVGIDLAKGELIAFLDSDDFWAMPDKLEKQVALFEDNPDLGCINTGWKIVDGAGKHIKTVQPWHKAPKLDLETWLKKKCVRTSAMVFRQEWLKKVGGFDEELRQSHDVDLVLRLSLAGCQTVWLKEETVCYRQHGENTTKNSVKQAKYVQMVLDKFFARNDLPELVKKQESQTRYHTLVWLAWFHYRAGNLDEMAKLLQKSLDFSPYLKVENISHWLTSFKRFSQERGINFNTDFLTNSSQWQKVTMSVLGINSYLVSNSSTTSEKSRLEREDRQKNSDKLDYLIRKVDRNVTATNENLKFSQTNLTSVEELSSFAEDKIKSGNFKQAIDIYSKALNLKANAWEINLKLGRVWQKVGDLEKAISFYQQAIELQPKQAELYWDLGQALFKQGKGDEGIKNYIHASKLKPNHHRFQSIVADMMQKIGKMEDAIKFYRRSIELKPEEYWNYFKLGAVYEKLGQLEKSANNLSKSLEIKPDLSLAYKALGHVREMQGRLDDAIECYQKAIFLQPDLDLSTYRTLGQALQINNKSRMDF